MLELNSPIKIAKVDKAIALILIVATFFCSKKSLAKIVDADIMQVFAEDRIVESIVMARISFNREGK